MMSGDVIMEALCSGFDRVQRCIFITGVCGILVDPAEASSSARIYSEVVVDAKSGTITSTTPHGDEWTLITPACHHAIDATPDVTGGIWAKLRSAARIASRGVNVYITGRTEPYMGGTRILAMKP